MTAEADTPTSKGKRIRLTIDISPELRRRIKIAAAQRDLSVRMYVEQMLEQAVPGVSDIPAQTETEHVTQPETLDPFRKVRDAILQTTCGRLLDDSVEEIRRMREERTLHLESL